MGEPQRTRSMGRQLRHPRQRRLHRVYPERLRQPQQRASGTLYPAARLLPELQQALRGHQLRPRPHRRLLLAALQRQGPQLQHRGQRHREQRLHHHQPRHQRRQAHPRSRIRRLPVLPHLLLQRALPAGIVLRPSELHLQGPLPAHRHNAPRRNFAFRQGKPLG